MAQYFSAVEGDPLSSSRDSYVMDSGVAVFFSEEGDRAMAFVGGNAYCGKCKSVGKIVGGAGCSEGGRLYNEPTRQWQAVAGDFVQCKCETRPVILARYGRNWIIEDTLRSYAQADSSSMASSVAGSTTGFDELMVLLDDEGKPVAGQRFRITLGDGSAQEGTSNNAGETVRVSTKAPMRIEIELLI